MAAFAPFQAGSQLKAVQSYRMDFKTAFLMKSQLLAWVANSSNTEVLSACCTDPLQTLYFFCPVIISVWAIAACNSLVKVAQTLLVSWPVSLWKVVYWLTLETGGKTLIMITSHHKRSLYLLQCHWSANIYEKQTYYPIGAVYGLAAWRESICFSFINWFHKMVSCCLSSL